MNPLVTADHVSYEYPDGTLALDDIALRLASGEFLAMIGGNGSGKTTLCKCLTGLLTPTSGSVTVDGIDTRRKGVVRQLATKVGYVFQNPDHQLFNQSVWNEIAYGPRNLGMSGEKISAVVGEAARIAGIEPRLYDRHPHFLHKGLRQRVAIASVLAMRPWIIIIDEPTTGQDLRQTIEVMDFLRKLRDDRGHTIVIITHEMDIVARYAERTVVLGRGRVLLDGRSRDVFAQPEILEQTGVLAPQITRLGQSLAHHGLPRDALSVSELFAAVEKLLTG